MAPPPSRRGRPAAANLCTVAVSGWLLLFLLSAESGAAQKEDETAGKRVFGGADNGSSSESSLLQLTAAERQALQMQCQDDMQKFIQDNQQMVQKRTNAGSAASSPDNMLFFLHVPRTAGRTFFSCFLKQATPPSKRCAKSYDVLRLNVSVSDCGLLSSHDDYSVAKYLPEDSAIITQIRNPVDRVLSAYEFSVEVAARELRRPPRPAPPQNDKVNTRNVWPWSLLVPWMEADMRSRIQKERESARINNVDLRNNWLKQHNATTGDVYYHNYATRESKWELQPGDNEVLSLDPYNNPVVMPLREFIDHPLVRDTVHNGATLQVLGLTNYSHLAEAQKLRSCINGLPNAKEAMTKAALSRLRTMYHVGTTEQLEESIASIASSLGVSLGGPSWKGKADAAFSYEDQGNGEDSKDKMDGREEEREESKTNEEQEAQKNEWAARIDKINVELGVKDQELRKAKAAIRTSRHKAQTVSAGGQSSMATAEIDKYSEAAKQLNKEIDGLKAEKSDLQVRIVKLNTAPPKVHSTQAKLVQDDQAFKNPFNLTTAYHKCVSTSRAKNSMRWKSLLAVRVPDGRPFSFSYEARKNLAPKILQRIRELNSMDVRLYELAQTILKETRASQSAAASLEKLDPPPKQLQAGEGPPLPPLPGAGAGDGQGGSADAEAVASQAGNGGEGAQHASHVSAVAKGGIEGVDAPSTTGAPRGAQAEARRSNQQTQRGPGGGARIQGPGVAGLNRAPRGPGNTGTRRRKPNPDDAIDYRGHEEL